MNSRKQHKIASDLVGSLTNKSQFLLSGNIFDLYLAIDEVKSETLYLRDTLAGILQTRAFQAMLVFDRAGGLKLHPLEGDSPTQSERDAIGQLKICLNETSPVATSSESSVSQPISNSEAVSKPTDLSVLLEAIQLVSRGGEIGSKIRIALVIDFASQLVPDAQELSDEENQFFLACKKESLRSEAIEISGQKTAMFNPIIWLLDREGDLPAWFSVGNDRIKSLPIPMPDYGDRLAAAKLFCNGDDFLGYDDMTPAQQSEIHAAFAAETESMNLSMMDGVLTFLQSQPDLCITDIAEAVRLYRVGMSDNPWRKDHVRKQIRGAERELGRRVKGQPVAITRSLDILKRSVMGLTGSHTSSNSARPRGVLFFAGPTGVGKTELVKAITQSIFGNERAYVRFDMSEFNHEQADQRLIGAPPGYVGYEAGGELTNAVRERPFSVILFDEIEKAHGRIFDKFLQILEDGRLTDARGNTVYFSESVIVFTSNLGIYTESFNQETRTTSRSLNVTIDMDYKTLESKIRAAIIEHFQLKLGRPEILNRIGDNIVVFDFIRPEVAVQIFDGMIANIRHRILKEHDLNLTFGDIALHKLRTDCLHNLENGGRGIGNQLESRLVNPLARALFDAKEDLKGEVRVIGINEENGLPVVVLE